MAAGKHYSGTPLSQKLGAKPGAGVVVLFTTSRAELLRRDPDGPLGQLHPGDLDRHRLADELAGEAPHGQRTSEGRGEDIDVDAPIERHGYAGGRVGPVPAAVGADVEDSRRLFEPLDPRAHGRTSRARFEQWNR